VASSGVATSGIASSGIASSGIASSGTSSGGSSSGGTSSGGACAAARTLQAGTNSGQTSGTTDTLQGCSYNTGNGTFTVGGGAPEQVWRLDLAEAKGLRLTFSGFDGALYILNGTQCATAVLMPETCVDREGDTETLEIGNLLPGTYWVVVDGYDDGTNPPTSGAYTLGVELLTPFCERDPGEGDEGDDNDTLAHAVGPVDPMGTDAALTLCQGDEDWFTVLHGGGDLAVTVRAQAGQTGTLAAALLKVARAPDGTPTGTPVASATYANGTLSAAALEPGEYAVHVTGTGQTAAGILYAFNVTMACQPDDVEQFYGLNDTLATAIGPIGTQDSDVEMALCPGDVDFFLFTHQGGSLTVKVAATPGATGTLAAQLLAVARDASGTPTGTPVVSATYTGGNLTAASLDPGEYTVRISGTGIPATGLSYLFNVTWSCTAEDLFEYAPNNDAMSATGPLSGLPVDGVAGALCPGDVDWLWFSNSGTVGNILVTVVGGANLTVEAREVTVVNNAITAVAPAASANVVIATAGANKTATWTAAPEGANFVLKIAAGAAAIPAAGTSYTVKATMPAPANDTCAGARVLTLPAPGGAPLVVTGSTAAAADDRNSTVDGCTGSSQAPSKPEVFYSFTPTVPVKMTARVAGYDSLVYLLAGGCNGTQVACNDDEDYAGGRYDSLLADVSLSAGVTYVLAVDSYAGGGSFTLTITTAARDCGTVRDLVPGSNTGNTTGLADNDQGCTYATAYGDFTVGANAPDQTWKLVLAQPKGLRLSFSGFDGALYLRQGDTCGTAVLLPQTCVDREGDTETLEIGQLAAGTYWVVVDGYHDGTTATSGAYTLQAQVVDPFCERDAGEGDEGEDNDSLANAVHVGPMSNDARLFLCQADEDWFTFINGGGDVSVKLLPDAGQVGSLTAALQSVTRAPDGTPTGTAVASAAYANGNLTATGLDTGEYAVRVSGTGLSAAGIPYAFNLSLACEPDGVESYYGLNNTLATALGPIGTQEEDVAMALCPTDVDWFTFVHQGGNMTVKAAAVAGSTGTLAAELHGVTRDAAGVPTGTLVAGTTYAGGNLTATALPPGEYAARLSATGQPAAGLDYLFNVTWSCTAGDDLEGAPNNDGMHATGPLGAFPAGVDAALCPGDEDWLWFVNQSGPGNIVVTIEGGASLTVEARDVTVVNGVITSVGAAASANVAVATAGANKTATWAAAPVGAQFVIRVARGAAEIPAAGVSYVVKSTLPAPPNDTCANATTLTLPAVGAPALVVTGSTGAAADNGNSSTADCTGSNTGARPDVFYKFTPTANARVTIRTTGYDSIIYLRSGSCAGSELACNDDEDYVAGNFGSLLSGVAVTGGTTYYLAVDSYGPGGDFTLTLSTAAP
jgi:hypothetical protein